MKKIVVLILVLMAMVIGYAAAEEEMSVLPASGEIYEAYGVITMPMDVGIYHVFGQKEKGSPYNYNFWNDVHSLPEGFTVGHTYQLIFDRQGSDLPFFRIYFFYANGTFLKKNYSQSQQFVIPEEVVGMILRLYIPSYEEGMVDATVAVGVYDVTAPDTDAVVTVKTGNVPPPMLTIIDDDGDIGFYRNLLPLVREKHVPIATAVTSLRIAKRENGTAARWMSWAEIEECYASGCEVLSHTYAHHKIEVVETMSTDEIAQEYVLSRDELVRHGIPSQVLVYNGASGKLTTSQTAASMVFSAAIRPSGNKINHKGSIDPYNIWRFDVAGTYDFDPVKMRGLLDMLQEEGTGWMVWIVHTSSDVWEKKHGLEAIADSIDYAASIGLPIVTTVEAMEVYLQNE